MANGTTNSQGGDPADANRKMTVADPDDPRLRQLAIAGGTYTILVTGAQTAGRYCLTDMHRHAIGAVGVLHGGRRSRREPRGAAAEAR
jgi:hypothetical protein